MGQVETSDLTPAPTTPLGEGYVSWFDLNWDTHKPFTVKEKRVMSGFSGIVYLNLRTGY